MDVNSLNERTRMLNTKWYIWSMEHNAWWKPGHNGYTQDKKEAGLYPYSEALAIVDNANRYSDLPKEAMIFAEEISLKITAPSALKVEDPLNADLPVCKECNTQVTFIELYHDYSNMENFERYSCKCGETTLEKPEVKN